MEKWKEICAQQAARLENTLNLSRRALDLCAVGSVRNWLKAEDIKNLNETKKNIENKLTRLKKGEFHIAVVGTEKAGKSSFINAWLESDLLPSKQARCTFTTTRLHSAKKDEQRLEVFPKTHEQMEELIHILGEEKKSPDKHAAAQAEEDLKLIKEHRSNLDAVIADGEKSFNFTELDEISDNLNKYAADPCYAHAIRQVDLYTSQLASMDNILFYDVPGLNSGLSKHIKETQDMLEDSDAVIIVKDIRRPSFDSAEKEILRYAEKGDSTVPIKDKVFLFLSRLDEVQTREGFLENQEVIFQECGKLGIAKEKLVFGAAAAVLLLKDRLKDTRYINDQSTLKTHLCALLDLPPDSETQTIIDHAGIKTIQEYIERYLEKDRVDILRESCDKLINNVQHIALEIRDTVSKYVPEDPTQQKRKHDDNIQVELGKWIEAKWEEILASISDPDKEAQNIHSSIEIIAKEYKGHIKNTLENLPCFSQQERETKLKSLVAKYGNDEHALNTSWRSEILYDTVLDAVQKNSEDLSTTLHDELKKYMKKLSDKFNNCIDVQETLLKELGNEDENDYRDRINSAIRALFLRYARPLVQGLIKYRHGIPERKQLCENDHNRKTFRTLMDAFPEEDSAFADLFRYIKTGEMGTGLSASGEEAPVRRRVARGIGAAAGGMVAGSVGSVVGAAAAGTVADAAAKVIDTDVALKHADPLSAVIAEVEQDRKLLQTYLEDAVFECSGIYDYADQEFERLHKKFVQCGGIFGSKLRNEFNYNNPKLQEILPEHLQHVECDTRVSDLLHQLIIALENRR